jgi:hypothetical protein
MNRALTVIGVSLLIAASTIGEVQAKKLYGYTASSNTSSASVKPANKSKGKSAKAPQNSPQLVQAVQSYSQGKYKDSAERFEFIDSHGGCCDKVHYFLGLDYQNMNQTVLAQMHYQWVVSNSKNPRLRQYADAASEQLAYYQAHRSYSGQGGATQVMSFG